MSFQDPPFNDLLDCIARDDMAGFKAWCQAKRAVIAFEHHGGLLTLGSKAWRAILTHRRPSMMDPLLHEMAEQRQSGMMGGPDLILETLDNGWDVAVQGLIARNMCQGPLGPYFNGGVTTPLTHVHGLPADHPSKHWEDTWLGQLWTWTWPAATAAWFTALHEPTLDQACAWLDRCRQAGLDELSEPMDIGRWIGHERHKGLSEEVCQRAVALLDIYRPAIRCDEYRGWTPVQQAQALELMVPAVSPSRRPKVRI